MSVALQQDSKADSKVSLYAVLKGQQQSIYFTPGGGDGPADVVLFREAKLKEGGIPPQSARGAYTVQIIDLAKSYGACLGRPEPNKDIPRQLQGYVLALTVPSKNAEALQDELAKLPSVHSVGTATSLGFAPR